MALIETIAMTAVLLPVFPILSSDDEVSLLGRVCVGLLLFCAVEIWFLFQYGFISMLLRLVQKKFVTMGFIFMGFKTLRKSLKPTLFLTVLCSLVMIVFQTLSLAFHEQLKPFVEKIGFHAFVYLFAGALALVCALILIHFAFLFQISFESETSSFRASLKKNHHLMKGNRFALVRLMLIAAGRPLLVAVIALVLESILTAGGEKVPGILGVISLFLSFIYFVNAYTAFIRAYFSIPVLYDSVTHVDVVVQDAPDENRLLLEETAALLSDGTEGEGSLPRSGEDDGSTRL